MNLYEDFHCPHCAEFEEEFAGTLTAPSRPARSGSSSTRCPSSTQGSAAAANAMACAAEAGFGQPYYTGLFANQTLQWSDEQLIDARRPGQRRQDPGQLHDLRDQRQARRLGRLDQHGRRRSRGDRTPTHVHRTTTAVDITDPDRRQLEP